MNARTTALSALIAVRRQNAWADGALKEYIARDRLSRRDAALAARLVYGVVQNRLLLDFDLAQVVSSPLAKLQPVVLDILRLGAYQILFLDKIPVSAAVNEAVEQTKIYANKRAAGRLRRDRLRRRLAARARAAEGHARRAAGPRDKIFPPPAARRLPARVHGRRNARGLPCR